MPEHWAKFSAAINKDGSIVGSGARPSDIKLWSTFIDSKGATPANKDLAHFIKLIKIMCYYVYNSFVLRRDEKSLWN